MSIESSKIMTLEDGQVLYNDLRDRNFKKADAPVRSASGSIATFDTDVVAPLQDCEIQIEPVQDLHGYDNPWPAGGGKNFLPIQTINGNAESATSDTATFTKIIDVAGNAIGVKISTSASTTSNVYCHVSRISLPVGSYKVRCFGGASDTYAVRIGKGGTGNTGAQGTYVKSVFGDEETLTVSETAEYSFAFYICSGKTASNVELKLMVCLSTDTTTNFAPYSNICPITGWAGVNVSRTGKNLLRIASVTRTTNGITYTINKDENGSVISVTASGTASANSFLYFDSPTNNINEPVYDYSNFEGESVTISGCPSGGSNSTYRIMVATRNTGSSYANDTGNGATFTMLQGTTICIRIASGTAITTPITFKPMLRFAGETDDTFEPFGTTYPITWQSEAGTVYGGNLNVTTGVLTVDRKRIALSTLSWTANTNAHIFNGTGLEDMRKSVSFIYGNGKYKTSSYKLYNSTAIINESSGFALAQNNTRTLYIKDPRATTVQEFEALLDSNQHFLYELATPVTYQLTPVQIRTLLGKNNVWADAGDVSLKYEIDMENYVDDRLEGKGDIVVNTASGSIVSIADGADRPVKSLVAQIEPVQDLHGYGKPWPGGAGKNLIPPFGSEWVTGGTTSWIGKKTSDTTPTFPFTYATSGESAYSDVPVYVYKCEPSTTYTLTPPSGLTVVCSEYANLSDVTDSTKKLVNWSSAASPGTSVTKTTQSTANYLVIGFTNWQGSASITVNSSTQFQLEKGSSATSYEPYSNICPITGWTGMNAYKTGKNLLTDEDYAWANGTGAKGVNHTAISSVDLIPTVPGEKFTFYRNQQTSENSSLVARLYNASRVYIGNGTSMLYTETGSKTITIPANAYYVAFTQYGAVGVAGLQVQVERGDTYTGYEEPTSTVYPISWQSEAGTVYGGNLNVTTGVLTVTDAIVDLGNYTWTAYNNAAQYGGLFYSENDNSLRKHDSWTEIFTKCNKYKSVPNEYNQPIGSAKEMPNCSNRVKTDDGRLYIRDDTHKADDGTAFKESLSGTQLVYELATPVTYQLTPTEIRTLLGNNSIFADTGDVSVEYCADTKKYAVHDVRVNGLSVTSDGTANIPVASASDLGVVKVNSDYGVFLTTLAPNTLAVSTATSGQVKAGTNGYKPITPSKQHESVFYGLAKLAGADMASSANAVGTFTDDAKVKIQKMLGIYEAPWELIREDTVTNATAANVDVTVDGNGNAFELTDVIVVFVLGSDDEAASYGNYGVSRYYYGSNTFDEVMSNAFSTNAGQYKSFIAYIEQEKGLVKKTATIAAVNGGNGNLVNYATKLFSVSNTAIEVVSTKRTYNKVTFFSVQGKATYRIYGKRKWTL